MRQWEVLQGLDREMPREILRTSDAALANIPILAVIGYGDGNGHEFLRSGKFSVNRHEALIATEGLA